MGTGNMNWQIANGGVQYVPQIAVQYVYLDFDGELTDYNGEILTIEGVEVRDPQLTQTRIADILAELNKKYASQNVIFVTERPVTAEYSTIFIGKTEAFDQYGNFAGLAETVDLSNANKSDNAFVNLDSTAANEQIISTISHETDHLLGTLKHGGDDLAQYACRNSVYTGTLATDLHLSSHICDGSQTLFYTANNVTIVNGGKLWVPKEFSATNVTVSRGGYIIIGDILSMQGGRINGILSACGGGITNYGAAFTICDNARFYNTSNHDNDGLFNAGHVSVGRSAIFSGLNSSFTGGALCNTGSITLGAGAQFINNYGERGGAIYTESGYMSFGSGAIFSGNSTWWDPGGGGQAIANHKGTVIVSDNALFQNNSGVAAGAIANYYESARLTVGNNAKFVSNSAYKGAAIYNESGIITLKDGLIFSANTAETGGGGAIYTYGSMTLGNRAVFSSNCTQCGPGGAIFMEGSATVGNSAYFAHNSNSGTFRQGGAIYCYGTQTIGSKAVFSGNYAGYGGAIYAGTYLSMGAGAAFINNKADDGYGGALYITSNTNVNIGSNAVFSGNIANVGGAIYADGYDGYSINIGNNAVFSGNIANGDDYYSHFWSREIIDPGVGGAVFLEGVDMTLQNATFATVSDSVFLRRCTLTVNGDVSFAGNILISDYDELKNNGNIDLNISVRTPDDGIFLDDWEWVGGNGTYSVTVSDNQRAGEYQLVKDSTCAFDTAISLRTASGTAGTLRIGGSSISVGNYTYSLKSRALDTSSYSRSNMIYLQVQRTAITKPDLCVRDYEVSTTSIDTAGTVKLTFKIVNNSDVSAGASVLKIYDGDNLLRTFSIDAIAANSSKNCTVTLRGSELATGARRIYAVVDADNQLNEYKEDNNRSFRTVNVTQAIRPDLRVPSFEVSKNSINTKESTKLTFQV